MTDQRNHTTTVEARPRRKAQKRAISVTYVLSPKQPGDAPVVFDVHPKLPDTAAKLLLIQYVEYRCAGDDDKAARLVRLSASEAAGRAGAELDRSSKRPDAEAYFHSSVMARLCREKPSKHKLETLLRGHPERLEILAGLRMWGGLTDEPFMRAHQTAKLITEQVELSARPLRPDEIDDALGRAYCHRRLHRLDRGAEDNVLAHLCEQKARELARDHMKLGFVSEAEREDEMILSAVRRLAWYFNMRGEGIVSGLVGEALGRKISPSRVQRWRLIERKRERQWVLQAGLPA